MKFRAMSKKQRPNYAAFENFGDGSLPSMCKLEAKTEVIVTTSPSTIEIVHYYDSNRVVVIHCKEHDFQTREETELWIKKNIPVPVDLTKLKKLGFRTEADD